MRCSTAVHAWFVGLVGLSAGLVALAFPKATWMSFVGLFLLMVVVTIVQSRARSEEPSWLRRNMSPRLTIGELSLAACSVLLMVIPLIALGIRTWITN